MERYTITLFDGKKIIIQERDKPIGNAQAAQLEKKPLILPDGTSINGANIALIEPGTKTGEYGPHLAQIELGETLSLADAVFNPKNAEFFWAVIVKRNMTRKPGQDFYHNSVIHWALANSGFTGPQLILEFLDAEWENAKEFNVPPEPRKRDAETERLARDFYGTEAGQEYAMKMRYR